MRWGVFRLSKTDIKYVPEISCQTKANTVKTGLHLFSLHSHGAQTPKTRISHTLTLGMVLKAQPLCNLGLGHDLARKSSLSWSCRASNSWFLTATAHSTTWPHSEGPKAVFIFLRPIVHFLPSHLPILLPRQ